MIPKFSSGALALALALSNPAKPTSTEPDLAAECRLLGDEHTTHAAAAKFPVDDVGVAERLLQSIPNIRLSRAHSGVPRGRAAKVRGLSVPRQGAGRGQSRNRGGQR